jgi:threonine dehydratase
VISATAQDSTVETVPTLADVYAARGRLRPYLKPTPLVAAPALSEQLGLEARLKLETLQPIGAFKVRGGINLVGAIHDGAEPTPRGFMTASTGNHGQSIAYAARLFGYPAVVYAPEDCNIYKAEAMRRLGAELVLQGADFDAARESAEAAARERGYRYIGPIEALLVAGVATATLEIFDEWPEVEVVVVPLGGGSGAAAACLAGKGIKPELEVIAVQASGAPAFHNSWKSGRLETTEGIETFAEGLATRTTYPLALRLLRGTLDDVVLVSDGELERAMVDLLRHAHVLAEAAGAASTAAVSQAALRGRFAGRRVALMVSGANVTPEMLQRVLNAQL